MIEYTIKNGLNWRTISQTEREKKQVVLLQKHLHHACTAPFYRDLFGRQKINIDEIRSISDISRLPLTSRKDLDIHGHDLCAVPQKKVVDLSLTSGTTGSPVHVPYTQQDLDRLAYNEAIAFHGAGISKTDTCLISVTLDRCFVAGLAYYSGIVHLGATAVRSGPGQPARQWELIRQLKPTVLVGVPTFLVQIAEWAEARGYRPETAGIKKLITIGEPVRRADMTLTPLGRILTESWKSQISASYGATELETGICECQMGCGGHIHPELSIAEIIDEHGNCVEDGQPGELVITPLGVEGFPLIRFCTGDITRKHPKNCECGWQTERIGPIEGRVAQRLKMRGTTLYPEAIFLVLQEISQIKASYIEVRSAFNLSDEVKVIVGGSTTLNSPEIESLLQARLRVRPEVVVRDYEKVIADMTPVSGTKPKRFFDYRNQ